MCLPVLAVATAIGIVLADRGMATSALLTSLALAAILIGGRAASAPRRRFAAAVLLALVAGAQAHLRQLVPSPAVAAATGHSTLEGVVSERAGLLAPRWLRLERVRGIQGQGVPSRVLVFPGEPGSLDALHPGALSTTMWRRPTTPASSRSSWSSASCSR